MEFFTTLGSVVGQRWKEKNYNEEVFPEIAAKTLTDMPPAEHTTLWDIVMWAMTADQLPRQDDIDAKFGNPPLTVFIGRKFRIEVLFWTQGTPSIHQHGFSGAFHVMHGSSIHTIWDFHCEERIEARLLLGRVSFKSGEILHKGDCRRILAGNALFHSTYHVDRPSISVVVRTLGEPDKQPQFSLLPPTIARATQEVPATVQRQVQLLRMLIAADRRTEFNEVARHMCGSKDAYSVCEFILSSFELIEDDEERQNLLHTAKARHPTLVSALEPALLKKDIGNRIMRAHATTDSSELRFFLALLRNIPERTTILRLIAERFSGRDPIESIVEWASRLMALSPLKLELDHPIVATIRCLLMNLSADEIAKALRERFGSEFTPDTTQLHQFSSAVRSSWLLGSLCEHDCVDLIEGNRELLGIEIAR